MKRLFAIILILCLLGSAPALAASAQGEYTQESTSHPETVIRTTIGEEFTLIIPPVVNVRFNQLETPLTVQVTNLRITAPEAGKTRALCVEVAADAGKMVSGSNAISYTLAPGEERNGVKALFFDTTGTKDMKITITQDAWDSAPAGSYTSTVTFNAAIQSLTATN